MTLPQNCRPSVIPLFGRTTDHSSVPAKTCTAVARSGGRGRPSGRRASASPLTAASTIAALRSLRRMLCIVVILAASMLSSGTAHAEQESTATRRPSESSVRPYAAFATEASKRFSVPEHWIRAPTASHRIVALALTCARTAHHALTALSTYRPSYPTLATYSYIVPAR